MLKKTCLVVALVAIAPAAALAQDEPAGGEGGGDGSGTGEVTADVANPMTPTGSGPSIFKAGTLGLSFGVPSGGGANIGITKFNDANNALDLLLGFDLAVTGDTVDPVSGMTIPGGTTLGLNLGLGYRMYKHHSAKVHTFIEPAVVVTNKDILHNFADNLGVGVAAAMGAEVMFTEWFSIKGSVGAAATFTDKFKSIDVSSFTSGLTANMYWE